MDCWSNPAPATRSAALGAAVSTPPRGQACMQPRHRSRLGQRCPGVAGDVRDKFGGHHPSLVIRNTSVERQAQQPGAVDGVLEDLFEQHAAGACEREEYVLEMPLHCFVADIQGAGDHLVGHVLVEQL